MNKYITIPKTKVKLYPGAIITLPGYPNSKFMLSNNMNGWYLKDTATGLILNNITGVLLDNATVVSTGTNTESATPLPDSTKITQISESLDTLIEHAIVDSGYPD